MWWYVLQRYQVPCVNQQLGWQCIVKLIAGKSSSQFRTTGEYLKCNSSKGSGSCISGALLTFRGCSASASFRGISLRKFFSYNSKIRTFSGHIFPSAIFQYSNISLMLGAVPLLRRVCGAHIGKSSRGCYRPTAPSSVEPASFSQRLARNDEKTRRDRFWRRTSENVLKRDRGIRCLPVVVVSATICLKTVPSFSWTRDTG